MADSLEGTPDLTSQTQEPNLKEIEEINTDNASSNSENINERQIVVFKLSDDDFGVNITEVREIIKMENITEIPNCESYIKGVINLRGGIIVVIDLAKKIGLPEKEEDKNTRIIVIEVGESTIGMIVDSATEVQRLSNNEIKPAPSIVTQRVDSSFIEGVGIIDERLLILLDLTKVTGSVEENITNLTQ